MCAVYSPYIVILVKKISCKKFFITLRKTKTFNNEIFVNYGIALSKEAWDIPSRNSLLHCVTLAQVLAHYLMIDLLSATVDCCHQRAQSHCQ